MLLFTRINGKLRKSHSILRAMAYCAVLPIQGSLTPWLTQLFVLPKLAR